MNNLGPSFPLRRTTIQQQAPHSHHAIPSRVNACVIQSKRLAMDSLGFSSPREALMSWSCFVEHCHRKCSVSRIFIRQCVHMGRESFLSCLPRIGDTPAVVVCSNDHPRSVAQEPSSTRFALNMLHASESQTGSEQAPDIMKKCATSSQVISKFPEQTQKL